MDRRHFLRLAVGMTGAAAHAGLASWPAFAQSSILREGIYTSRFTHRRGIDGIEIHATLLDVTSVDVTLKHLDGPVLDYVVGVYTVSVDASQISEYPGIPSGGVGQLGPAFPVRLSLDTDALGSGLYEISIDPLAMRPENRETLTSTGLVSNASVARFVVTAPTPGSESNILWLHDSQTGTAYGGFGEESIYGGQGLTKVFTASYHRPAIDRGTSESKSLLRKLKADGYSFEYMDAVEFSLAPPLIAHTYDLIVVTGQFEYLPHSFFANLMEHVNSGRNLFLASNEIGAFRSRLDPLASTMTTYKTDADLVDPVSGVNRAGVGLHNPDTIWETEFAGLNVWGANNFGPPPRLNMTIISPNETGWIFEGTGFSGEIPNWAGWFVAGNRGQILADTFTFIDPAQSRVPSDTVVWVATPAPAARQWWDIQPGIPSWEWPFDADGHALCTWRETNAGARIIAVSSQYMLQHFHSLLGFERMFENLFTYVSQSTSEPPAPVSSLGLLGKGALTAGAAALGTRVAARAKKECDGSDEPQRS